MDLNDRRSGCFWPLAAAGVVVLAACLGVLLAGRKSLDVDEADALATAQRPLRDLLEHVLESDLGQLVQLLVLHPVARASDAEWAVRAPSAVALALAVALTYPLGARLFGRVAGLTAALALATCAGAVAAAQHAHPYPFALLGIVLSSLLLLRGLERGTTGRWVAYGLSAVALPLLHPAAASILAAHAVAAVSEARRDVRRLGGVAAGIAVALPLVVALALERRDAPDAAPRVDIRELAEGAMTGLGWNLVLLVAGIAGIGLAAAGRVRNTPAWHAVFAGGLVVAPVAALLVAAVVLPVYPDRVLVLTVPGLALGAGAAVAALPQRSAIATAAVLTAAAAATLVLWYASPSEEDWRSAARAVERERGPGETVVVVPPRAQAALGYYAPDVRTWQRAHGDGAWVLAHARGDVDAITRARTVVSTPRYALAEDTGYGDDLRLQHWVRP